MAAARLLSVRGVVYCVNEAPLEGRLCVELTEQSGALISGTMTEPDGTFTISTGVGSLMGMERVVLTVWWGAECIKRMHLSVADALSRHIWVPIEPVIAIIKVSGCLYFADGLPAGGQKIRVLRVVGCPDGRPRRQRIGDGVTDASGVFSLPCLVPRSDSITPLIQIQAYGALDRPSACVMVLQTGPSIEPVSLTLPDEGPTLLVSTDTLQEYIAQSRKETVRRRV